MSRRFGRNQKRRMLQQMADMQWLHDREEQVAFRMGMAEGYHEARERFDLETVALRAQLKLVLENAVKAKNM